MREEKLNELRETFKSLKEIRTPVEREWKEIVRFVSPRGGDFDYDTEPRYRKGDDSQMQLFDKTIYLYSQIFAMGLKGYVCSSQSHFFSLIPSDPRDIGEQSKRMLQAQTEQMYDALASTRFYKATEILFSTFGNFGTAVMLLGYDTDTTSFLFRTFNLGDCFAMKNRFTDVCDVLFHVEWLTRAEAIEMYGEENLSETIRNEKDYTKSFRFIQLFCPRDAFRLNEEEGIPDSRYLEIAWEDLGAKDICYLRGTEYRRFLTVTFGQDPAGGAYATDYPGIVLLNTAKALQRTMKDQMNASQLMTNPPIQKTKGFSVKIRPGAFIDVPPGQSLSPLQLVQDVSWTNQIREDMRAMAKQAYFVDFFLMLSQYQGNVNTATLAQGLQSEQVRLMSAFLDNLYDDFFSPLLQWVRNTMMEQGLFYGEAVPDAGTAGDFRVKMVSELYRLQKKQELSSTADFVNMVLPFAQYDPDVMLTIDFQEYAEVARDKTDASARIIRDRKRVEKVKAAAAEAKAAAMQQQMDIEQQKANASTLSALGSYRRDTAQQPAPAGGPGAQGDAQQGSERPRSGRTFR